MATKFIQDGKRINYTPGSAVAAGDVVVLGALVCVATEAIAAGEAGSLAIEGVFEFPKTGGSGGSAMTQGQRVDWDAANGVIIDTDATAGTRQAGYVFAAAADTATTVQVKLQPASANLGSGS